MAAPTYLVLDRASALLALEGLATSRHADAMSTYTSILVALSGSPNGGRSIRLAPISDGLVHVLRSVHVRPGLVSSVRHCRYVAVYRHPEDPTVPDVTVRSYDRPRKRRTLSGPGGRRRYIRVSLNKEEHPMAARTTRTRAKSRTKAKPAEELDDLEALEELEDLEDVEEDEPAPKSRRRSTRAKAKPAPEPEDDDEDEDDEDLEDEDEEDEEPAPRKRRATRSAKAPAKTAAKQSAKPAAKAKAKPAAKRTPPAPRAMPSGKMSVNDLAEQIGTSGAALRQWLRRNDYEVDPDVGRYAFTKTEAKAIVKKFNA